MYKIVLTYKSNKIGFHKVEDLVLKNYYDVLNKHNKLLNKYMTLLKIDRKLVYAVKSFELDNNIVQAISIKQDFINKKLNALNDVDDGDRILIVEVINLDTNKKEEKKDENIEIKDMLKNYVEYSLKINVDKN